MDTSGFTIREIEHIDLSEVLRLRNHERNSLQMLNKKQISSEEHEKWFEKIKSNSDSLALILLKHGNIWGFAQFSLTRYNGTKTWGFYTAPEAAAGTGVILAEMSLDYAFLDGECRKICGEVLESNKRSIRLHQSIGFKREGTLVNHYYDGSVHQNIVCFAIWREHWLSRRKTTFGT